MRTGHCVLNCSPSRAKPRKWQKDVGGKKVGVGINANRNNRSMPLSRHTAKYGSSLRNRIFQQKKLEQKLHETKTHLNSLQLSLQAAEQTSVTAQCQVMVFALTMVAVCLAFVYHRWWSMVASVHVCLGVVVLMLVVGQPVMALFRPRPSAPRRCSLGWVHWAVALSA